MKILISGEIGSGKSTLLHQLCSSYRNNNPCKIYGFRSEKIVVDPSRPDIGKVYLHPYEGPYVYEERNCIAELKGSQRNLPHLEVFESYGCELLANIPPKSLILMDEIGFLERDARLFSLRILQLFHENHDILAVIKPINTPLLNELRALPEIQIYQLPINST
ncbi:MAG: hypothetical protein JW708_03820 [Vallitaleaceae bacterium]|nr:hypothetical protein [Vallitaleaceae bacterium]